MQGWWRVAIVGTAVLVAGAVMWLVVGAGPEHAWIDDAPQLEDEADEATSDCLDTSGPTLFGQGRPRLPTPARERPVGGVTVRVTDEGGAPIPRFEARRLGAGWTRSAETGELGELHLEPLALLSWEAQGGSRDWFLEVWNARDLDDRGLGYAPVRVGPFTSGEREIDVRLTPGTSIEGRVFGPDGPVAGVDLVLRVARPDTQAEEVVRSLRRRLEARTPAEDAAPPTVDALLEDVTSMGTTDADGAFLLALHVPADVHELAIVPPPGFLPTPNMSVRAGDPPIVVQLQRCVSVRITVVDPDGAPVWGARVGLRRSSAPRVRELDVVPADADIGRAPAVEALRTFSETTDREGVASFDGLLPGGRYLLHVYGAAMRRHASGPRHAPLSQPMAMLAVDPWTPADTRLVLPWGYGVEGRVLDRAGRPVARARVGLGGEAGRFFTETSSDGSFSFAAVPAGRFRVLADATGRVPALDFGPSFTGGEPRRPDLLEVDVGPDVEGLVLRVPSTSDVTLRLPESLPARTRIAHVRRLEGGRWRHVVGVPFARTVVESPVRGLESGEEYWVWIALEGGAYVDQSFRAGEGTVRLHRSEGGTVTGVVRGLPQGAAVTSLALHDEQGRRIEDLEADEHGRFEARGLPDASWTVTVECEQDDGPTLVARGSVRTGAAVELALARSAAGTTHDVGPKAQVEPLPAPGPR